MDDTIAPMPQRFRSYSQVYQITFHPILFQEHKMFKISNPHFSIAQAYTSKKPPHAT